MSAITWAQTTVRMQWHNQTFTDGTDRQGGSQLQVPTHSGAKGGWGGAGALIFWGGWMYGTMISKLEGLLFVE